MENQKTEDKVEIIKGRLGQDVEGDSKESENIQQAPYDPGDYPDGFNPELYDLQETSKMTKENLDHSNEVAKAKTAAEFPEPSELENSNDPNLPSKEELKQNILSTTQKPDEIKNELPVVEQTEGAEDTSKTVMISGYLPQDPQLKNHKPKEGEDQEKAAKQSYNFSVAQNTKEGTNYTNIRVSEKFFDSVKDLKAGHRVDVSGYPKSYDYKDSDGHKQTYDYLQAGAKIELVKDQKVKLSGNLGSDVTIKEHENGKRADFSLAVQGPIKGEKPTWYQVSAGERFFDENNMPEKGDLVELQGYVGAKTGNLEKKDQEYKFGGNVKLSDKIDIRAKKGQNVKLDESNDKSQGQKF